MPTRLLIIEDDPSLNQMLALHFEDQGFEVAGVGDCRSAFDALHGQPDLILLDQQLPDGLGVELLPRLLERSPNTAVIMMTGQHDLELAIQAIQQGAADFVHKPVRTQVLQETVDKVLRQRQATRETQQDKVEQEVSAVRALIGRGEAMLKVSKEIALSAENAATVLVTGESGTGKEVVARLIHQYSGRSGAFVAINCAAIVDSLLESELFGHERGAFTGADAKKIGKFELAADGTLFLDEIGELAGHLQAKLLRVLQERSFERVGGTQTLPVRARIIAATHRDLFARAAAGEFREDLAYRLAVVRIQIPPLRDRREDIPLLVEALINKIARQIDQPLAPVTEAALAKLRGHDWPGNVRELENLLTQAMVRARDGAITPELIEFQGDAISQHSGTSQDDDESLLLRSLDQVEAEHIQKVLTHTGGHKGKSCDILGISRPALDRKILKYGLRLPK